MKYIVKQEKTLLEALEKLSPGSSKTTCRSWLKDGRVEVEGKIIRQGSTSLKEGQTVELGQRKKFTEKGIRIIFEDPYLVAVEKPAGLLSVSTKFETGKTVHAFLKSHFRPKRVFVVHRLDQETSGVMLFALTEEARDKLKILFEKHELKREYAAIVEGRMPKTEGTWTSLLYEDDFYRVHTTEDPNKGQVAITHYKVLNRSKKHTSVNLQLETGRKNQIRVHCQEAGFPVAGDEKYGAAGNPLKRLCLHAHHLGFIHPITKKEMHFSSPIPEEFLRLIPFHEPS